MSLKILMFLKREREKERVPSFWIQDIDVYVSNVLMCTLSNCDSSTIHDITWIMRYKKSLYI